LIAHLVRLEDGSALSFHDIEVGLVFVAGPWIFSHRDHPPAVGFVRHQSGEKIGPRGR